MIKHKKIFLLLTILIGVTFIVFMLWIGGYLYFFSLFVPNDIPQKKLVNLYKVNASKFDNLVKYAVKINEDIGIDIKEGDSKKFILKKYGETDFMVIDTKDDKLKSDISYILFKLKFFTIFEQDNSVYFIKQTGIQFEQGLAYSKDGRKPLRSDITVVPINNRWYYYKTK